MKETYIYPAVFKMEDGGLYSIYFPDLESCYTCGDDLEDGILNAQDVLSMVLYRYMKEGKKIPSASGLNEVKAEENEFV